MAPARSSSFTAAKYGANRRLKVTVTFFPVARSAWRMARHFSSSMVMGFSVITSQPNSSAWMIYV
ncbi:hypothetical protein D3C76_1774750 [compost metagenome]